MKLPGFRIVSGGQTGADRAALDWAIAHGIPHGGWCPKGRLAEDGPIEPCYLLAETPTADYAERTEWNVRDSDGTVVFSLAPQLSGGSRATVELAQRYGKPWLHLAQADGPPAPEQALLEFLRRRGIRTLNVAGPRASVEPAIGTFVRGVLERTWETAGRFEPTGPLAIGTERLVLRALTPEDAQDVALLAGRREIADTTISIPHPLLEPHARTWIETRIEQEQLGTDITFAIARTLDGRLIGTIGLRDIDREHSLAEMGFWIGVEYWSQGFATEAAQAVLRFAFEDAELNRVYAHHMVRNPASGRVLERIGMKREGLLRQRVRKWGVFEDVVLLAILRAEWLGTHRALPSP